MILNKEGVEEKSPTIKRSSNPLSILFLIFIGVFLIYWAIKIIELVGCCSEIIPNISITTPSPTPTKTLEETENLKLYLDSKFGFKFQFPGELHYDLSGPNDEQLRLEKGEVISGTITPSYEIIIFSNPNRETIFSLGIFHETETLLTPENYSEKYLYLSGNCDLRRLNESPNHIENLTLNKNRFLKVTITEPGKNLVCYYFKNLTNNLIVLSSAVYNQPEKLESADNEIKKILSTLELISPNLDPTLVNASNLYLSNRLPESDIKLLSNFYWPKLKTFKIDDKTRQAYLVDCEVTNDNLGVKLTGVPEDLPNVPNLIEPALKKMVEKHLGGFPDPEEIANYEKYLTKKYANRDSGINGVILKGDGALEINFFDSVAAYGGGSARVECLSLSTILTAMQFSAVKKVIACIDKYPSAANDYCAMDFQP